MSILSASGRGWVVSHEKYMESVYENTFDDKTNSHVHLRLCGDLFKIKTPFKGDCNQVDALQKLQRESNIDEIIEPRRRKRKIVELDYTPLEKEETDRIQDMCVTFLQEALEKDLFEPDPGPLVKGNKEAMKMSSKIYSDFVKRPFTDFKGANYNEHPVRREYMNEMYVFPAQSTFYNKDVKQLGNVIDAYKSNLKTESFDLVVLDPPWWNKYIRQKRRRVPDESYQMMYNHELGEMPVSRLLAPGALVAVWCTNSKANIDALEKEVFPAWGVKHLATWYWLKVTRSGTQICPFSLPRCKQPFERLLLARAGGGDGGREEPPSHRIVASVPSSLHSHKPPLDQLLVQYLPTAPKKLELFARYLLPGWSSYGNQVLLLQHASLYAPAETKDKQPGETTDKQSVDPTDKQSVDPTDKQSVDPTDKQSVDTTDKQSVDPTNKQLVDSTNKQLVDPTDKQSVDPTNKQSVDPTNKQSVDSTDKQSVDPTDKQSVDSTDKQSVDSTDKQTVDPTDKQSVDSTDKQSVDSTDKQTVDPTDKQSVDPTDKQSVDPTDKQPCETKDKQSVEPTDKQSVEATDKQGTGDCQVRGDGKLEKGTETLEVDESAEQ